LATCRPLASAKPTDMAIARKLITKVFSIVSSSLDDAGHGFPADRPGPADADKHRRFGPCKLCGGDRPVASFATGLFFHEIWTSWQVKNGTELTL